MEAIDTRAKKGIRVYLKRRGFEILEEGWSSEALAQAQARHLRSRNELPYQAWRLSEGEPAIPTRYV